MAVSVTRLPRLTTPEAIHKAARESYYAGYVRRLTEEPRFPKRAGVVYIPESPDEGWPMHVFVVG